MRAFWECQTMKPAITIVEVAPRDGLQNEPTMLSTTDKLALIEHAIHAGARRIEVASFVNPRAVPQMAGAEAVVAALPDRPDISYIGLCLNRHGVIRALDTRAGNKRGVDEAGCVVAATDSFGQRNQRMNMGEMLAETAQMLRLAIRHGLKPQVSIAVAFGCPFEGVVPAERVVAMAQALADAGVDEIALADTIGVAVPDQIADLFGRVAAAVPGVLLRAHLHNTRGTGIANAWAAVQAGVHTLDSSLGGIGGCPFAPRATGNIATEDLVYLLERSGFDTGLDLDRLIAANAWLETALGHSLPSMVGRAGGFPAAA